MNIQNEHRSTTSTEGKNIAFTCNKGWYFVPPFTDEDKDFILKAFDETHPFAIVYTEVMEDRGFVETTSFGTPIIERYNNGPVGWQNIKLYDTEEEARKELAFLQKLTPKVGTIGYCDVFLVSNND